MSATLALAAVSAVMKSLLLRSVGEYGVRSLVGNALAISAVAPDLVPEDAVRLNLHLFRCTPNLGWLPEGEPSRGSDGRRTTNPYLALDLHYLITAHGQVDFQNEVLLGYAMQIFHENRVLDRAVIREALRIPPLGGSANPLITANTTEGMLTALAAAGLADQIEQIKLAPYKCSVDETSQIWSALNTPHRPMAAYTASVVLIRSSKPARQAPPVRSYGVYVEPLHKPVIESVGSAASETAPVTSGSRIRIRGQALASPEVRVAIGATELAPGAPGANLEVTSAEVQVTLPAGLRAGLHSVQIRHLVAVGAPSSLRRGWESNTAGLLLRPTIDRNPGGDPQLVPVPADDQTPRQLRASVSPEVTREQRVFIYLNQIDVAAGAQPNAYAVEAPARGEGTAPTKTLVFPIGEVASGRYLARVQVDGAESPLDFAEGQGYVAPAVSL
jgi:hypothetical protein